MKAQSLYHGGASSGSSDVFHLGLSKSSKAIGGQSKKGAAAAAAAASAAETTEEMQIYFSKLKDLVPFMPRNRKLSKLEIIQYVIDYICDLQLALEGGRSSAATGGLSPTRQPLGVIANVPPNTTLTNTCAAQEANHEKLPSHLEEVNTRPVSC